MNFSPKYIFPVFFITVFFGCAIEVTKTPQTPQEHLNRAAEKGEIEKVRKLLSEGVEPSGTGLLSDGIEWALYRGHTEIAKLIIDRCLEIYVKGKNCGSFPFSVARIGNVAGLKKLFEKGLSANEKDSQGFGILGHAASEANEENAKFLISRGAEIDPVLAGFVESTIKLQAIDHAIARDAIVKNRIGIALLKKLREAGGGRIEINDHEAEDEKLFANAVKEYRKADGKLEFPEEARKYKIQAEDAIAEKQFDEAAKLYSKALSIALWWPEGHFNRAIVLGENRYFVGAIKEMKRYLTLVPNATDAREAQDKIYLWERKASQE